MLDLHITATDLNSFQAKILGVVGLAAGMSQIATEDLLVELRQRLAVEGTVVRLLPFDSK